MLSSYKYRYETIALCRSCCVPIAAELLETTAGVYLRKRCPAHGLEECLVSSDPSYFWACVEATRFTSRVLSEVRPYSEGCPFDCGLCEEHQQAPVAGIIELLDECNMRCPTCIAASAPGAGNLRTLREIDLMLGRLLETGPGLEIVLLSGGEPTMHPEVLAAIDLAHRKGFKRVFLITNGYRIAHDQDFSKELADRRDFLEIYLQFDSLNESALRDIRGADLRWLRRRVLEATEVASLATTLVCVVKKAVNDKELGDLIRFGLTWPQVRGVTFQPIRALGRVDGFGMEENYITLSEVRSEVLRSGNGLIAEELVPHPCNPEGISIGYLRRGTPSPQPITRELLGVRGARWASWNTTPASSSLFMMPHHCTPELRYDEVFRVAIVEYLDANNFTVGRAKRSCIVMATPEGAVIPVDTYFLPKRAARNLRVAH